jgi:hypothetical protein
MVTSSKHFDVVARATPNNLLALLLEGEDRGEGGALKFFPHPRPLPQAGEGNRSGPCLGTTGIRNKTKCYPKKKTNF